MPIGGYTALSVSLSLPCAGEVFGHDDVWGPAPLLLGGVAPCVDGAAERSKLDGVLRGATPLGELT